MRSWISLLAALSGGLALNCKSPEPTDTDTGSSGSGSTSTSASTSAPTSLDPTTTSATTGAPTTGDTSGEPVTGTGSGSTSSTSTSDTNDATTTTATTGGSSGDATTMDGTTGPVGPCKPIACDGKTYACGDCEDNDSDGKVDLADSECISPCDDREDTFATGLPGDNMDPCKQDCFFDGNSGNDACDWNLACDPKNPGGDQCPYNPDKVCEPMQPAECAETCGVPNGCDCFGCCTVVVEGVSHDIFIGDKDCSVANIESCQQCTKNDDCDDECKPEECEVCFGGELPPGCEEPTCDRANPCQLDNEGNSDCPEGTFCQTGCCEPIAPG
ncbi:MAG TPA: hypothetical protein VGB85_12400 [Nannocystis sp.]